MKEIVTEINIAAAPSRIWKVLTNFEKYSNWNPFMTKVSGRAVEGEKLEVTLPNPQGGTMVISPTILRVEDEKELRWLGRTEGDTFNGEHSFILEPTGQGNVRFVHSEKFTGSKVAMLEGWLDTSVRKHFEDMNRALKDRAEAIT
ncbi:MAG TPA: SRPBCC domain-containing protein [Nitrososphaera sp.]|nr:SRPBCC domain-containing protein [Nitrososphaera sp.]